jgi:hypothetical protein
VSEAPREISVVTPRRAASPGRRRAAAALAGLLALAIGVASAEEPSAQAVGALFNWYYAATFGTGVYTIAGDTVTVVAVPIGFTLREPGEDRWGVRLSAPVSAALANFDYRNPEIDATEVAALSFLPTAEVVIPIGPHWRLRPYAGIGHGSDLRTDTGALIYQIGATTAVTVPAFHDPGLELGARLVWAGYDVAGAGGHEQLAALSFGAGTAFRLPLALCGHATQFGVQAMVVSYFNDVEFLMPNSDVEGIRHEYELGLTLRLDPPGEVWGMGFDRLGLAYRVSSDRLRAIRLVTEFPF